ncbi:MAG: beta-ketoacyl synthase N-terminal-like domain-containing protein [bacterium]
MKVIERLFEQFPTLPERRLGIVAATSKGELGKWDVGTVCHLENPGIWSGTVSQCFPLETLTASPNTACATGLTSLIHASRWIAHGTVDHALVICSESSFLPLLTAGYANMGVLCDEDGMLPFDSDRTGFALAEGSAVVYLATDDVKNKLEVESRGQILGWMETSDAHHITNMDEEGRVLTRTIQGSVDRAGIARENVDLLHAHLTTTEMNDRIELNILQSWEPPALLQGIKPALGHTIGAAGLIEAIGTLDVLRHKEPFPITHLERQKIPSNLTLAKGWDEPLNYGVTWNSGFGGHNASLALRAP